MKKILYAVIMICTVGIGSCQEKKALKVSFDVKDDLGHPVADAELEGMIFDRWEPGQGFGKEYFLKIKAKSDSSGKVVLDGESARGGMTYWAHKPLYYSCGGSALDSSIATGGQWQPWNPTEKVELKRILNPIPLIAKKVKYGLTDPVALPAYGVPVGYDLESGDWVMPYGKGKISDLFFQMDGRSDNLNEEYTAKLKISFSNQADGLLLYASRQNKGSQLKMPHLAPMDGYIPELIKHRSRILGTNPNTAGPPVEYKDDTSKLENYFLRVRTTTNAQGEVTSACYAKVYGPFEWFVSGKIRFQYYFNPTPNDRNLEFDPKRNLLNLPEEQQVKEP